MKGTDLKSQLKGKVAILGFGNRLWSDDGAGSVLAERLKATNPEAPIFDGGMVPENYLEKVVATNPDTILLIDATDFGAQPGEWRIFSGDDLMLAGISTHAGSPRLLSAYLKERTGVQAGLLAIQPEDTSEGSVFSDAVASTVSQLTSALS